MIDLFVFDCRNKVQLFVFDCRNKVQAHVKKFSKHFSLVNCVDNRWRRGTSFRRTASSNVKGDWLTGGHETNGALIGIPTSCIGRVNSLTRCRHQTFFSAVREETLSYFGTRRFSIHSEEMKCNILTLIALCCVFYVVRVSLISFLKTFTSSFVFPTIFNGFIPCFNRPKNLLSLKKYSLICKLEAKM